MDFQVKIGDEDRELLKEFLNEFKALNEHLNDFKIILAPMLGYKVKPVIHGRD